MVKEDAPILVRYKYETSDADGDLVCELTEFMDKYLLRSKQLYTFYKTYLYNDIGVFSEPNCLQIAFRVPRSY